MQTEGSAHCLLFSQGSYTDGLPSNREQLSATAAAAVAAAASTLTAEDPWNLEMEVEVTRTVHSNCGSWLSIALIGEHGWWRCRCRLPTFHGLI